MKKIVDCFNDQVLNQNDKVLKNNDEVLASQVVQAKRLSTMNEAISSINSRMEAKQRLKHRFMYILKTYIRERDSFNMMTSAKEKELLIKDTHDQVELL